MFERYTESARRALFFARYEASQLGGEAIEADHLLLGLTRHPKGITGQILAAAGASPDDIRKEVEARSVFREKLGTSVEIPFSADTKRVLEFAAQEADGLLHNYIGTEHLLLGLLRVDTSPTAATLASFGLRIDAVRTAVRTAPGSEDAVSASIGTIVVQIERIRQLLEQLGDIVTGDARGLVGRIQLELDALRRHVEK